MFWLIEDKDQLNNLGRLGYKEAFIEPIGMDIVKHPAENELSFVYVHPLHAIKGFIISINHSEALSIDKETVIEYLKEYDTLYTVDKKNALHYLMLGNLWDIMIPPHTSFETQNTLSYDNFIRINSGEPNLNYIFPLSKQYEYLTTLYNNVKDKCSVSQSDYAKFYNNKVIPVFTYIENSGIKIDKDIFEEFFHKVDSDTVYTKYNTKTTTTRPSNSFRGVNYAALNKSNHCRRSFIPTEGNMLVEFDFTAYHPSLIAKLIKYDLQGKNIHEYFANLYETDYEKAKQLTFQQIYGNIFPKYSHLEFFKRLKKYISDTWDTFNNQGYYECPISSFIFLKDSLDEMNPAKLLNYILQNLETSNNILVIWDIIKLLKNKKTKLILYTYDSFLFDFNIEDKDLLKGIKKIFKKHGFQYKINHGSNYEFN